MERAVNFQIVNGFFKPKNNTANIWQRTLHLPANRQFCLKHIFGTAKDYLTIITITFFN